MKDNEKLELLLERFYERYNKYNTSVLKKMGEAIKKFDGVSPSTAHKIAQQLKYGKDLNELTRELSKITNKSVKEIYEAFDIVTKENTNFAEIYSNSKKNKYKDSEKLKELTNAIAKETSETLINISDTRMIGFSLLDKKSGKKVFKPLKNAYYDMIDEAVFNVATGTSDYQSAMRKIIKELSSSGVKKIDYKSGYARRIDSTVRQNVLEGVRQVNIDIQEQIGKEIGSTGVEISAHYPCAEDHLSIQGRQFTNKEFEKLNARLDRPIGELNCRHFVFSIIKGVNKPSYTNKELQDMKKESQSIVKYQGNKYTKYEATQIQRKLETSIRKQKDLQIIGRASGNKKVIEEAQRNITSLTNEYVKFSKIAGLDVYKNRMAVSGYHRVKTNFD